ncbi:Putative metallopeptidase (Zinc) SprT family [Streptococcus pyogenes]|nr:SprT-like family protein [Streptococcus pyogenes GA40468]SDV94351.1 Putative metallopeptidase (Zinc) SprT family [Streptococcus pyogenes]
MTLTNYVQEVSLADFGKPFHHKAYWNKRLKTTGGRFFPKDGHLDFNPRMLEENGELIFRKIVRHELCHYHLYFEGRGYHHKDRDFKDLLAQVNGFVMSQLALNQRLIIIIVAKPVGRFINEKGVSIWLNMFVEIATGNLLKKISRKTGFILRKTL